MRRYISFPKIEGQSSRQAHANLPQGTYEREIGKEGFFGPASHLYHRHPPTGWSGFEGSLRPYAFDLAKLADVRPCPWQATPIVHNASIRLRHWRHRGAMRHLVRNADGDDLLFLHQGHGELYCD